jgi:hypothetical protein
MKVLVIGGERHGEFVDTLDGARVWLDIQHAVQHRVRRVTDNVTDATGAVVEAYVLHVAVHQDLTGPNELQFVGQALAVLAQNAFFRAQGEPQDIPKEPAGSSLIVPENGTRPSS